MLNQESLMYALSTGALVNNSTSMVFTGSGGSASYVYINTGAEHKIMKLIKEPLMFISQTIADQSTILQETNLGLSLYNFNFDGS